MKRKIIIYSIALLIVVIVGIEFLLTKKREKGKYQPQSLPEKSNNDGVSTFLMKHHGEMICYFQLMRKKKEIGYILKDEISKDENSVLITLLKQKNIRLDNLFPLSPT